jgi:MFS family permease
MSPPPTRSPRSVVLALGTAQTVAWASSFYLPTLLAAPMARDLGITPPTVFAALSAALVIGALVSPWAGRRIDQGDGRSMLLGAWALFVAGLGALALAQGLWSLVLAWALLGLAMGCGLYDAAVRPGGAALDQRHHADRRLCQHRGLAADGVDGGAVGLARRLRRLDRLAHAGGAAADPEPAAGAASAVGSGAVGQHGGRTGHRHRQTCP